MNFFGGGQDQQPKGPDPVFAAKTEMEMYTGEFAAWLAASGGAANSWARSLHRPVLRVSRMHSLFINDLAFPPHLSDLFNKISSTCFNKCASRRHKEPDLALGEMSCTE